MWTKETCRLQDQFRRAGGAPSTRAEVHLWPVGTMVEQISMLQPIEEPMVEQAVPCSLWGTTAEQVDLVWRRLQHMVSPSRSRLQAGAATCEMEPTVEQESGRSCCWWGTHAGSVPEGWIQWYTPILEQFLKKCSLWEAHVGSIWEGMHPDGETPLWRRQREWRWRSSRLQSVMTDWTAWGEAVEEGRWQGWK